MDNQTESTVPRRLHRRTGDRMLAGVSGGLADYTGADPVFFRIGFIVLALAGGAGLLLYALGWLLIPEESQPTPIGQTLFERVRGHRWFGFVLVGVFSLILLNWFRLGAPDWNVFWAIGLVAIGFVLLRDEPNVERAAIGQSRPGSAGVVPVAQPRVKAPRRPRSPLGFMTLGAAFVAVAISSLLMGSNVIALDPGQIIALVVLVLGLGLVVGSWWGRARSLVLIAMLLTPVMIVASMVDAPIGGSFSQDYHGLRRHVEPEYQLLVGTLTLDYSRFRFVPGEPSEVDLSFFAGDVNVYVPPGVRVEVNGELDLGVADLFGDGFQGRNLTFDDGYERRGLTEGALVINVDGGLGSFDTTWAGWVDQEKRFELRQEQKKERKTRERREEMKNDGRGRDSK